MSWVAYVELISKQTIFILTLGQLQYNNEMT